MAYTRSTYKGMANTRISSRYNQLVALVAAVIIGMIISSVVNAVPSAKATAASKITITFDKNTQN